MIEQILDFISSQSPFWIYVTLFFFSYIENVFPPSPSDLVIVVGGSLIVSHSIHFVPMLLLTSAGSVLGFMTLFFLGSQLDKKLVRSGKIKFISVSSLDKAEKWFAQYGYLIILGNRFLPGMRSIISFFAGLSELEIIRTALYASISSLLWNAVIIFLGIEFGRNVSKVDRLLSTYSNIVLIVIAAVVLFFLLRFIFRRKKAVK